MATIVEALLSKTISEQEDIATLHIAALHLFPGLLYKMNRCTILTSQKKKSEKIVKNNINYTKIKLQK